ncbi:hypothetical protein F4604DRAFT_1688194 [Suillus subluteus]|nr:hypothetical protein F4604DRAFT_1688194 [Suillus subluteus]
MNSIPANWALATTHLASDYVYHQFCSLIGVRPKVLPPAELNCILLMACSNLAKTLTDAYLNPVRYSESLQMMETGLNLGCEESLFARFPLDWKIILEWPAIVLDKFGVIVLWYLPGAIDLAIQAPKFHPEVSVTLRAMQRLAALIAAALRVMHPSLYWSSLTTKLGLGLWADNNQLEEMGNHLQEWVSVFIALAVIVGNHSPARMQMPNIGIEIAYNSGRIVRHGMDNVDGDQMYPEMTTQRVGMIFINL